MTRARSLLALALIVAAAPASAIGFTHAFDCGEVRVEAVFAGDKAMLRAGQGVVELDQMPAASGARYATADGQIGIWTKGDNATVTLDGTRLAECRPVAPEPAAVWRARGNEPGWTLTVDGGRMRFTPFDGATAQASLPDPRIEAGALLYTLAQPPLRIAVAEAICRDSMTGMPHPQTVTVETGGERLTGCGGAPIALIAGREWVVEDIGGGGLIDSSHVTLQVSGDGKVSGSGGCNRLAGRLDPGGERLAFGPLAATRMACAEALMRQEQRFFETLATIDGFDLTADGALVLTARGLPAITARR